MIVVDASAAMKWLLPEPDSDAAFALLAGPTRLQAPDLLPIEVASGLAKKFRRGEIAAPQIAEALLDLHAANIAHVAAATLLDEAVAVSVAHRHAVFDCLYLALARRAGGQLATFDQPLAQLATRLNIPLWTPA